MSKDYEVGYGKPPVDTRFQPGQSGNKKGRPKGTKNLREDLGEELAEKITVTEGGQQLVISKQRAMLKSMFAKAIKGDTTAARALVNLIIGIEQIDSERSVRLITTEEDMDVLEAYTARILAESENVDDTDDKNGDEEDAS
jgi:hypothetical protein